MELLKPWADFLWEVRAFFRKEDFLEVFTPLVVLCPGTEPAIEPFKTELQIGRGHRELFLRTSPELKIKRLLGPERPRLFEMGPVFRNEESTSVHEPEFTMLEWYRNQATLEDIQNDVEKLIRELVPKFGAHKNLQIMKVTIRGLMKEFFNLDVTADWKRVDYQLAITQIGCAQNLPKDHNKSWSLDDYFFFLMQEAEKKMDPKNLYFVSEYPGFQAAYSQLLPNGWAGRFEVYWEGMEIANAFLELTDPEIQLERFKSDIEKKKQMGKSPVPLDEEFLSYLFDVNNSPSGIALGLERLFMALVGIKEIKRLKPFPYSDLL